LPASAWQAVLLRSAFTALLLAPLAAPMNFQGLETVKLQSSNDWN
jgi:hypothetical protein